MDCRKILYYICIIVAVFSACFGLMVDFGVVTEYMTMKDLTAVTLINCGLFFGLYATLIVGKGETNGDQEES